MCKSIKNQQFTLIMETDIIYDMGIRINS